MTRFLPILGFMTVMRPFLPSSTAFDRLRLYSTALAQTALACSTAERRALDFWLGSWTVTTPDGKPAGTNVITAITDGCGLLERWESPGADGSTFRGTGLHVYDPIRGVWKQLWTDTAGRAQEMEGEVKDGVAIYRWTIAAANGPSALGRYTVSQLSGGRVRQLGERSTDGGRTWLTTFDYLYAKARP